MYAINQSFESILSFFLKKKRKRKSKKNERLNATRDPPIFGSGLSRRSQLGVVSWFQNTFGTANEKMGAVTPLVKRTIVKKKLNHFRRHHWDRYNRIGKEVD
jgi:hypothetical protein